MMTNIFPPEASLFCSFSLSTNSDTNLKMGELGCVVQLLYPIMYVNAVNIVKRKSCVVAERGEGLKSA